MSSEVATTVHTFCHVNHIVSCNRLAPGSQKFYNQAANRVHKCFNSDHNGSHIYRQAAYHHSQDHHRMAMRASKHHAPSKAALSMIGIAVMVAN